MFHSNDGLFFQRTAVGVRIVKTGDGKDPGADNIVLDQTIPHGSWCSAVCSVSADGEYSGRFYDAMRFHGSAP